MAGQGVDLFDAYFRRADLDRDGRITGSEAVTFFQAANLPKQVLAQVFRREVVFLVDISGSMRVKLLDGTKRALAAALGKLDPKDKFNILAFNKETFLYSSNMKSTTQEGIDKAIQWIHTNFTVGDGTNICLPLTHVVEMLSNVRDSVPMIFLITDGTVEDERQICDVIKNQLANRGSLTPRIHTFRIGGNVGSVFSTYCNHYFLRTLSMFGRGQCDAAYDPGCSKLANWAHPASKSLLFGLTTTSLRL